MAIKCHRFAINALIINGRRFAIRARESASREQRLAIITRVLERECAEAVNHVHARSTNTSLPNVAPVLNCEAVPS